MTYLWRDFFFIFCDVHVENQNLSYFAEILFKGRLNMKMSWYWQLAIILADKMHKMRILVKVNKHSSASILAQLREKHGSGVDPPFGSFGLREGILQLRGWKTTPHSSSTLWSQEQDQRYFPKLYRMFQKFVIVWYSKSLWFNFQNLQFRIMRTLM